MRRRKILSPMELERLIDALRGLREKVGWKSGKDSVHLNKRRRMGHLAQNATLTEYAMIISELVHNGENAVYLYEVGEEHLGKVEEVLRWKDTES